MVGLTLAGFGAITSTWRIRLLGRMVNLHLLIWMNIKTLLNYGTRSGRFFSVCRRLIQHLTQAVETSTRLKLCYHAYQPTRFKLCSPWASPMLSSTIIRLSSAIFVLVAMPAATATCGASSSPQRSKAVSKRQMIGCASCVIWLGNVSLRQIVVLTVNQQVFLGQLIFGVESDEVRVKLLEHGATLSLDQALTIIQTAEASNKQSKNLKTGDAAAIQGATSSYKRFKQKSSKPPAGGSSSAGATFAGCWNCGSKSRCKPLTACPAQGKDCRKCGLLNHYSKVCRNPKAATKKQQGIYIDPSPPTVGAVNTSDLVELAIIPEKWTSSFMINFLPDTGADLDAIPESLYKRKFSKVALQKGVQPVTAVGSPIISIGVFSAVIVWKTCDKVSRSVNTAIHVLRELKPVLSKRSQQTFGMLPPAYPHTYVGIVASTPPTDSQRQADLKTLMNECPRIFDLTCH